jgi:hypothetical protein
MNSMCYLQPKPRSESLYPPSITWIKKYPEDAIRGLGMELIHQYKTRECINTRD